MPDDTQPKIISASRRTDIPAFYADWFFQRLKEGYVVVRNPFNPLQSKKIMLSPCSTACIVFWTKNPLPMLKNINLLASYRIPFYFLVTLNSYGPILEPNVPPADEVLSVIATLSSHIGPERVIWRYDPIMVTDEIVRDYHVHAFKSFAEKLEGSSKRCIISFFQGYKKSVKNLHPIMVRDISRDEKIEITITLARIARENGMQLQWCAPEIDISAWDCTTCGIVREGCVNSNLIEKLSGISGWKKDPHQRKNCLCAQSVDIGTYNTCAHGCRYCYATTNHESAARFTNRFCGRSESLSPGKKPFV